MASELLMSKRVGGLFPIDPAGMEIIAGIAQGEIVKNALSRPRNGKHHAKYFALMNLIFQNQSTYATPENMRKAIEMAAGYFDELRLIGGETVRVPKSIAFNKLDQAGFEQVYDRVVDVICRLVIPGCDKADLADQLQEFA